MTNCSCIHPSIHSSPLGSQSAQRNWEWEHGTQILPPLKLTYPPENRAIPKRNVNFPIPSIFRGEKCCSFQGRVTSVSVRWLGILAPYTSDLCLPAGLAQDLAESLLAVADYQAPFRRMWVTVVYNVYELVLGSIISPLFPKYGKV